MPTWIVLLIGFSFIALYVLVALYVIEHDDSPRWHDDF